MKKRLLSTVLVFSMLLSVFPMNVIAVEDKTAENAVKEIKEEKLDVEEKLDKKQVEDEGLKIN